MNLQTWLSWAISFATISCVVCGVMWKHEDAKERKAKALIAARIRQCRNPYDGEEEVTIDAVIEGLDKRTVQDSKK